MGGDFPKLFVVKGQQAITQKLGVRIVRDLNLNVFTLMLGA